MTAVDLHGLDGLEVCRRIQADRPVPVIMLTAKSEEVDMVVGLGVGADDYMTKPFSPRELLARVRALLRRVERDHGPQAVHSYDDIRIDVARREVTQDGAAVHLTPTEFDLLNALAGRPGVVKDRSTLVRELWGYADEAAERTVDSHVRAIRSKLGESSIRTVRGVGYAAGGGLDATA